MEEYKDSIIIKPAETDEELCGRGYVHCTAWQEAYQSNDDLMSTVSIAKEDVLFKYEEKYLKLHIDSFPAE